MAPPSQSDAPKSLSGVLRELSLDTDETLSLGDIVARFGSRGFGALLFIFAVPNALPLPPGGTTIIGLPLLLIAPQLVIGVKTVWLPKAIRGKRIKPHDLDRIFGKIIPRLEAVERLSRPRLTFLFGPIGERVIGVICTFLALVIILPIPLGNLAPAITVSALAFGLFQRDGALVLIGFLLTALSVGLLALSAGAVTLAVIGLIGFFGG